VRPVSSKFLATLTGSHTAAFRVQAVPFGQTGVNPAGGTELSPIGGDVALDGGADIRSNVQLEIDGTGVWPEGSGSILTPYGAHELFIERGIAYGGGALEYVSLGYFRINDVEQPDAPDGPIRLIGADRMCMIIDATLLTPVQFPATDTYENVIAQLVAGASEDLEIEWDDADVAGDAIGRTFLVEKDRYGALRELVLGLGKIAYFDHRGVLLIRTPPSARSALWSVARGEGGVLVSASRSLSRAGVYNAVLATGEALDTEPPVRGVAVDEGADSPTRYGGPFGRVPREFASPLLTTVAQCQLAAATVLRRSTGLPYNVDFAAVPNAALEPDDPIMLGIEGTPRVVEPELLVGDSFSRTVVDGMGTTESGHGWSGTGATYQVNGGVLKKELVSANTVGSTLNSTAVGRRDFVAYVDVRVPVAAAGAPLILGIMSRSDGGSNFYTHRLEFNSTGTVTAKIARHSSVWPYAEPGQLANFDTYAGGDWWTMCVRNDGDELSLKAWPRDDAEPDEWLLTVDAGDYPNASALNRWGWYFWRVNGNTNVAPQWEVDNWRVYSIPAELVIGGELHVIDTLSIPLTAAGAMTGTTREQTLVEIGIT
jgi:hypothetical protein